MAKLRAGIAILLCAAVLYVIFIYDTDSGVIDDDYISSQSYQELETELQKNRTELLSEKERINRLLVTVLSDSKSTELSMPLDLRISALAENATEEKAWKYFNEFSYSLIGKLKSGEIAVHLLLLRLRASDKDTRLLLATSKKDSLLDKAVVGQYKDEVAEKVETEFMMNALSQIESKIIQNRRYPVEQTNEQFYQYHISPTGRLTETNQ